MSADFTIHVFADGEMTEPDFEVLMGHTLGTAYWRGLFMGGPSLETRMAMYDKVDKLPRFNVGEVSWLKAAIVGDGDDYVPGPIQKIAELLDTRDHPLIDDDFIDRVLGAFEMPNVSIFELDEKQMVPRLRAFLEENRGKRAFSVSW